MVPERVGRPFAWAWRGDAGARVEIGRSAVLEVLWRTVRAGCLRALAARPGPRGWKGICRRLVDGLTVGALVVGGISAGREPDDVRHVGVAAFLRVQRWVRLRRIPLADARSVLKTRIGGASLDEERSVRAARRARGPLARVAWAAMIERRALPVEGRLPLPPTGGSSATLPDP